MGQLTVPDSRKSRSPQRGLESSEGLRGFWKPRKAIGKRHKHDVMMMYIARSDQAKGMIRKIPDIYSAHLIFAVAGKFVNSDL